MPSLRSEPGYQIRSMKEFFALAQAMEVGAARHYTQTARALRQRKALAVADLFDDLSKAESDRVDQLAAWAKRKGAPLDANLSWPIPDIFDVSPEEIARTRLMTPYRAFALAVRREERAFAFWTYIAATADGEIKEAAERIALEELEHISLLRRKRRRAFHCEGHKAGPIKVTLRLLAATERHLADLIDGCSHRSDAKEYQQLANASRVSAERLDVLEQLAQPRFSTVGVPEGQEDDIVSLCEYLAEAYLRLAESARNEHVLNVAQELATDAIKRLDKIGTLNIPRKTPYG